MMNINSDTTGGYREILVTRMMRLVFMLHKVCTAMFYDLEPSRLLAVTFPPLLEVIVSDHCN